MPTIFGHAIAAGAAAQWWRSASPRFWIWTIACAMLPDADVISFSFGIRYEDMFGHRGFTHSLLFAAAVGALASWRLSRPGSGLHQPGSDSHRVALFVWFTAVTASHGLLDALTNGGRGIAFFAPFSNTATSSPGGRSRCRPSASAFSPPAGCARSPASLSGSGCRLR
jgi:inner membrane protein